MPPASAWNTVLMQDQFDAVRVLGAAPPALTLLPRSLGHDDACMRMRLARLALTVGQSDPAADVKKLCADLTK